MLSVRKVRDMCQGNIGLGRGVSSSSAYAVPSTPAAASSAEICGSPQSCTASIARLTCRHRDVHQLRAALPQRC